MSVTDRRMLEELMYEYINFGLNYAAAPLVSVIVPIYNNEEYLRECVGSIVAQTLKDMEIICVNDGSTDGSLGILKEYLEKDRRIRIINKPNTGYGHSMNIGIKKASGKYIAIVESDDYILPNMLEELVNAAEENELDLVKGDFFRFGVCDDKHHSLHKENVNICNVLSMYGKVIDLSKTTAAYKFPINTWAGIYRRSFLTEHNIKHNETPGASYQDNGFWFQTFAFSTRAMFLNKAYYMNRRDNPNSSVYSKEKVFCMCDEYSFIRNIIAENEGRLDHLLGVYVMKMFGNYMATYNRVDPQYKLIFLERFHEDMKNAIESGEIDFSLFDEGTSKEIESIAADDYVSRQFAKCWSKLNWNRERVKELEHKLSKFEPRVPLTIIIKTDDDYAALKKLAEYTNKNNITAEFICARTEAPSQRFVDLTKKYCCPIVRGNTSFEAVSSAVLKACGKYAILIDTVNLADEKYFVSAYSSLLNCEADVIMPHLSEDPSSVLFTAYKRESLLQNSTLPDRYRHLFRWRLDSLKKASETGCIAYFGEQGAMKADLPLDSGEEYFSSLAAYTVIGLLSCYGPSDRPTKDDLKATILPMFGITMDDLEKTDELFQKEMSNIVSPNNKLYT